MKPEKKSANAVDIQKYAHARRCVGGLLETLKLYQEEFDCAQDVSRYRKSMLGILLAYCKYPEMVEVLGLTDEQIARMRAGGHVPQSAVDILIVRLENIYANLSSYID